MTDQIVMVLGLQHTPTPHLGGRGRAQVGDDRTGPVSENYGLRHPPYGDLPACNRLTQMLWHWHELYHAALHVMPAWRQCGHGERLRAERQEGPNIKITLTSVLADNGRKALRFYVSPQFVNRAEHANR
jgi:ribosomal protein S18 acetylase RimI-like enzyme